MQIQGQFFIVFFVHHENTGAIFFMYFLGTPLKYRENIFHVFSLYTMKTQGQYFSCVFSVNHENTGAIFFMYFRSPPCK